MVYKNKILGPVSTLIGTIIGAGVLGLPYVFAKAGYLIGLINLIIIGVAILIMDLMAGEVCLRTKKFYQLAGLANKYLGTKGKWTMMISMMIGIWGAMLAYLLGIGASLSALFGVLSPFTYSLIFFVIGSAIVFFGLKAVEKSEILLSVSVVAIILLVSVFALFKVDINNLSSLNWMQALAPYGVVLFASLGTTAIPEMRQELVKDRKYLRKSILIGASIPIGLYALFTLASVGVMGLQTTEVATIGLGRMLGEHIIILGNLFAILAMAGSFLILGLALRDAFNRDIGLNKNLSFLLVITIPLLLFLIGANSFTSVLGVTGGVAGGLEGIIIASMWLKSKKHGDRKPEYSVKGKWMAWVLIAIFTGGIVYTVANLLQQV